MLAVRSTIALDISNRYIRKLARSNHCPQRTPRRPRIPTIRGRKPGRRGGRRGPWTHGSPTCWWLGLRHCSFSKLFKLAERRDKPRRLDNKDALDVFRLRQGTPADDLGDRLQHIIDDPLGHESGIRGIELLSELFGAADAMGSSMAAQAVVTLDDPAFVAASCAALSAQVTALLPARLAAGG